MIQSGKKTLLDFLENPVIREVPKGFKTIQELADQTGLSKERVRVLANEAFKKGEADRVSVLVGRCLLFCYKLHGRKKAPNRS